MNQGPAGLAIAYEVDYVDATMAELGEFEVPASTAQRRFLVMVGRLLVGHQAVEIDVGADLFEILTVEVLRVDFKDFDEQGLDVLDVQVEGHRFSGGEFGLVGEGKVEIDSFLELLVNGRRHQRNPLFRVSQAA